MSLQRSGGTVFVECTFSDPREDLYHGVGALLLILARELDDLGPIGHESSTEKCVYQEHVSNNIDKVEDLAEVIARGVNIMAMEGVDEVLDHSAQPRLFVPSNGQARSSKAVCEVANLSFLPILPNPVRYIEENSLEEEHEGDPLVVGVVAALLVGLRVEDAGVGHVQADPPVVAGQCERVRDPAERVDHVARHAAVRDARDRVTYEVVGGDEDAAEEEDGRGDPVVAAEDDVVDHRLLDQVPDLDEPRDGGGQCQHRHLGSVL